MYSYANIYVSSFQSVCSDYVYVMYTYVLKRRFLWMGTWGRLVRRPIVHRCVDCRLQHFDTTVASNVSVLYYWSTP